MITLFEAAYDVHRALKNLGIRHIFFGGLAVQHWGEPRVTRDVDLAIAAVFGSEGAVVDAVLSVLESRISEAKSFALQHRSLLCQSRSGIPVDIGLAAFPYEFRAMDRMVPVELTSGQSIPLVCAEDLITMKVFAGRPRDWEDVRGILVRQREKLDWNLVKTELPPLLELIDEPERLPRLLNLRDELS